MAALKAVEDELERLDRVILASEDWAPSFKKNPDALAKLIRYEAKLGRVVRRYFRDLASKRLQNYINWQRYSLQVQAYKYDVIVDVDAIDAEDDELMQVIHDPLQLSLALGAVTAQDTYNIQLGLSPHSEAVMKATQQYVGDLVKGITNTTKDRIKQSISTSLSLGEDLQTASDRLQNVITDPTRSDMITRTESVRSYVQGTNLFGEQSGATQKVWELSSDPCEICQSNYDNTPNGDGVIDFDSDFDDGDPPAHPNCRCDMSLIHDYSSSDSGDNSDDSEADE